MARVTVSFLLELRELSLHLNSIREQRALSARSAEVSRSRETRDRMVEQRKMATGSPCSSTPSLNHEFHPRCGSEPSRERESVRGKQAHHKLHTASHQVSHCERQPHGRNRLERELSRQELHADDELNPAIHPEHLVLIPEHIHNRDHDQ